MNLRNLSDKELLEKIKSLVNDERKLLKLVLRHLMEVDRRKLYCDLGYKSLFEYGVKELKYSEGQISRRIQAMRLMREIPEIEEKVALGQLNLSNIARAQGYFRDVKRNGGEMGVKDKIEVLGKLEDKSAREGEKLILSLQGEAIIPREKERILSETLTEVRFVMDQDLKNKLEEVRSLLGVKGLMNMAELIREMAELSTQKLKEKRFGKDRVEKSLATLAKPRAKKENTRTLSAQDRYEIWQHQGAKCSNCGSSRNLNFDHIRPFSKSRDSSPKNLRLLCFHCNQRQAMKVFGVETILKYHERKP